MKLTLIKSTRAIVGLTLFAAPVLAQAPVTPSPTDQLPPPPAPATPAPSASPTPPSDTAHRQREFQLGVEVGASHFTDATTRERFGHGFFIAPTLFRLSPASTQGTIQPDIDFTYSSHNSNRLIMGFLGAEYRRALTGDGSLHPPTQFHVGVNLGLVPASIRSPVDGVNSSLKVGVGGGVSAGYLIKQRVDLNARYTAISRIDGFNLSNVRVGVDVKF